MTDLSRRNFITVAGVAAASILGASGVALASETASGSASGSTASASASVSGSAEAMDTDIVPELVDRLTLHGLETDMYDPDSDVEDDVVDRICEAALTAPSAVGAKSLELLVIRDRETMQAIHALSPNANQLESCTVCIVLVEHDTDDSHPRFYQYDSGLAAMAALVQATAEGLCCCVMECRLQDKDTKADNDYTFLGQAVGETYHPQLIIALGYPAVDAVASASVNNYDEARIHSEIIESDDTAEGSASTSASGSAAASGNASASASASGSVAVSGSAAASGAAGSYKDGTYTGTGTGMGGKINVTLQISGGKITVTDISPNNETKGIGGYEAIQDGTFKSQIEAAQSADIEGVSGASVTSAAIKKAVADALSQAAA